MIEILTRGRGRRMMSRAFASLQEFLKGTIENVARATVRWVLGMTVSWLIAAALAVAALVFLLGAAVDGLIAAGLPSFAANLVMAVVAGGIGVLFYLRGKNKTLAETRREEEPEVGAPGLHVKIVRKRRAAPRRAPTRSAARKRRAARNALVVRRVNGRFATRATGPVGSR